MDVSVRPGTADLHDQELEAEACRGAPKDRAALIDTLQASQRIVIIGASGAGKTTLARTLSDRLQRPVINLDHVWYGPGWTIRPREEWLRGLDSALGGRQWIAEGNYAPQDLASRADLLIVLEHSAPLRLFSIVWRGVCARFSRSPKASAPTPAKVVTPAEAAPKPQAASEPQAARSGFSVQRYLRYITSLLRGGLSLRQEMERAQNMLTVPVAWISRRQAVRLIDALASRH